MYEKLGVLKHDMRRMLANATDEEVRLVEEYFTWLVDEEASVGAFYLYINQDQCKDGHTLDDLRLLLQKYDYVCDYVSYNPIDTKAPLQEIKQLHLF